MGGFLLSRRGPAEAKKKKPAQVRKNNAKLSDMFQKLSKDVALLESRCLHRNPLFCDDLRAPEPPIL